MIPYNKRHQAPELPQEKLQDVTSLQLPTNYLRQSIQPSKRASTRFRVGQYLVEQLQELSKQQGATLFMTLLATFKVFLQLYNNQADISVNSAIARQHPEVENFIGFFVNTFFLSSNMVSQQ